MTEGTPTPIEVKEQVDRICRSSTFAGARTVRPLLAAIVRRSLRDEDPQEVDLGIEVWGKPPNWLVENPNDTTVREGKRNLIKRLNLYYGIHDDSVIIRVPKGSNRATWEYNWSSPVLPAKRQGLFGAEFFAALADHFSISGQPGLRCVITSEPADWHHLDGNTCNNELGNLIPLSERLRSHLHEVRRNRRLTLLQELDPGYLSEQLAPHLFKGCAPARAYACAHLAVHMGELPYGDESEDIQIRRVCDALYYARHQYNGDIIDHLVRHLLLLISNSDSIDPITAYRITLEVTPILISSRYFTSADEWISFADQALVAPFESLMVSHGQLLPFARARRRAELVAERNPEEREFNDLRLEAAEHSQSNVNSQLALLVVTTIRWLRQGSNVASRKIHETLMPVLRQYKGIAVDGSQRVKEAGIDVANLSQLFVVASLGACRLRPEGWEETAREFFAIANHLQEEGGYRLSPLIWEPISTVTAGQNPNAAALVKGSFEHLANGPSQVAKREVDGILKVMSKLQLIPTESSRHSHSSTR